MSWIKVLLKEKQDGLTLPHSKKGGSYYENQGSSFKRTKEAIHH
jgi:hypothetical protein